MARKKAAVAEAKVPAVAEAPASPPDVLTPAPSATPAAPPSAVPTASQPVTDLPGLKPFYVNFARVTGSPEELILDFGLNPQPFGTEAKPIQIQRRLVLNFFTAKRLLAALSVSVQRYEQAFGELETDVTRRIKPPAGA